MLKKRILHNALAGWSLRPLHALLLALLTLVTLVSCQSMPVTVKAPLEEEGELYLYTKPFPKEADRLTFTLAGISAIRDDGREIPLTVTLPTLQGQAVARQRLLAKGELPPGNYRGLLFQVKRARVLLFDGEADLLPPEKGTRLDFSFVVQRKKGVLLSLAFDPERSIRQKYSFSPEFSISHPGMPVAGVVGCVTNSRTNTVSVFDKQAREVAAVIPTGRNPSGIVLDVPAKKAYVALAGDDAVEVIDLASGEIVNRIRLHGGDNPQELALTPDRRTLLTANRGSDTVTLIDTGSWSEIDRLTVGDGPTALLVDPLGQKAYVFNDIGETMSVIDLLRRAVLATVALPPGDSRGDFSRRGDLLYLTHGRNQNLSLVNTATLAFQQHFLVGMGAGAIKADSATGLVYIGRRASAGIEVYEPFSFMSIARIGVGGTAAQMVIDNDENRLLVLDGARGSIELVNLVNRKVVGTLDLDPGLFRMALCGER